MENNNDSLSLDSSKIIPPAQPTPNLTPPNPTESIKRKRFSFMHLLIFLCIGAITFISLGYYLLFWSPKAQAKEYVRQSTENFMSVLDKVRYFSGGFTELTESVEKSKEAFYEIATAVDYEHAKTDTEQDIKDITETLGLIAKAKANREEFNVPEELQSFDSEMNTYYENAENALNQLLAHQKLQMDMLNAYGDELNSQVQQTQNIVRTSKIRAELIEALDKTASLAAQSTERFRTIASIPDVEKSYYEDKLSEVEDVAATFASASSELKLETTAGDNNYARLISEMTERMLKKNDILKDRSNDYVKNSNVQKLFEENNLLEKQILIDINTLIKEYDIETEAPPLPSITPNESSATESAQPISIEEATGSANTKANDNTEESTPTAHFVNDSL